MIAIDTGGTFTDFVQVSAAGLRIHKERSTPADPAQAVLAGLNVLDPERRERVVLYGTTIATNALLERKGAPTALLTTAGFEDVLEIGRQARPVLYALHPAKPADLIPRRRRIGVAERIDTLGRITRPLGDADLRRALKRARAQGVTSLAIGFLNAFANPRHERRALRMARAMGFDACASHAVSNEFREYERFVVTAINAMTAPLLHGFLRRLTRALGARRRLWVMQSDGGLLPPTLAGQCAVRTILSGPAGGATGVAVAGRATGELRMIGLDIGGTSTDVCLCQGEVPLMSEGRFGDLPVRLPMVDVHSIGAGGGSIARLDERGRLRVGPESAGADPGPMCYGKGEALTVTDANLFLGRIDPRGLLAGGCVLDRERVGRALRVLGRRLSYTAEQAAEGIVAVANSRMEAAIRGVSVERGHDPRAYGLLAFGGGGGLHACALASSLGCPTVLVPPHPGVYSAFGMLHAPVARSYAGTALARWTGDPASLEEAYRGLERTARRELPGGRVRFERTADVRYVGQSFELNLPFGAGLARAFHAAHLQAYGYEDLSRGIEVVTLRLRATQGVPASPSGRGKRIPRPAVPTRSRLFERGRWVECEHIPREALTAAWRSGPALVLEYSATTYVPAGWRVRLDPTGHLRLTPSLVRTRRHGRKQETS